MVRGINDTQLFRTVIVSGVVYYKCSAQLITHIGFFAASNTSSKLYTSIFLSFR